MKGEVKLFITEDGSHSLQVPDLDETYHSSHGAIQESNHVFIKNGLEYWVATNKKLELSIFEVGFGTGLNALLTLQKSLEVNINYASIELYPLQIELTNQLNYEALTAGPAGLFKKLHKATWEQEAEISPHFNLTKIKSDFDTFETTQRFDLIYYDAFAPSKQPEMWSFELIKKCFDMLNTNGIFVTYSAKGQLKRDLKQAGFAVESLPGPPGKFEMVRALKETKEY